MRLNPTPEKYAHHTSHRAPSSSTQTPTSARWERQQRHDRPPAGRERRQRHGGVGQRAGRHLRAHDRRRAHVALRRCARRRGARLPRRRRLRRLDGLPARHRRGRQVAHLQDDRRRRHLGLAVQEREPVGLLRRHGLLGSRPRRRHERPRRGPLPRHHHLRRRAQLATRPAGGDAPGARRRGGLRRQRHVHHGAGQGQRLVRNGGPFRRARLPLDGMRRGRGRAGPARGRGAAAGTSPHSSSGRARRTHRGTAPAIVVAAITIQ